MLPPGVGIVYITVWYSKPEHLRKGTLVRKLALLCGECTVMGGKMAPHGKV